MLAIVRVAVEVGVEAFVRGFVLLVDVIVDDLADEVDTDYDVVVQQQQALDLVGILLTVVEVGDDRVRDLLGAHVGDDSNPCEGVKG
jgi:hypothetical protein